MGAQRLQPLRQGSNSKRQKWRDTRKKSSSDNWKTVVVKSEALEAQRSRTMAIGKDSAPKSSIGGDCSSAVMMLAVDVGNTAAAQ